MYPELSSIEIHIYFVAWISGLSYSVYHVYLQGNNYVDYNSFGNFAPGLSFINRRQDVSDYEWYTWIPFIQILSPWIIVHILGSEFIRWKNWKLLPVWYFTVTIIFLICFVGPIATTFMILQPCIMYICALSQSKILIWLLGFCMSTLCSRENGLQWLNLPNHVEYLVYVSVAWQLLRNVGFCLEKVNNPSRKLHLFQLLAYSFYLPVLFLGPLIPYEWFEEGISKPFMKWTFFRVQTVVLNLLRFTGWWLVTEICLHFLYFNAMQLHPELVNSVDLWTFYGFGYCMGQFFMLKYIVTYGLSTTIVQAEQIKAPRHPKCIARIHLYSHMWRDFDPGLYFFITRYIYVPFLGKNSKMMRKTTASFLCFAFVYVWHNTYNFILIWSTLNFLGITIEGIARYIGSSPTYQFLEDSLLTGRNKRRFHAVIATPLFIMSAISNFYFFGGLEIGNIYIKRVLTSSFLANIILCTFCYCCCQVSIEISNWEKRRKLSSV